MVQETTQFLDYKTEFRSTFKPKDIKEKIIPRLQDLINQSQGRYDSYVIWPEFLAEQESDIKLRRDGT